MQLRWTEEAANDLERIADYLVQNTPGRAPRLVQRIYDAADSLLTLPQPSLPVVIAHIWIAIDHSRRCRVISASIDPQLPLGRE
jgi:plasmid stabilization system protein ParE